MPGKVKVKGYTRRAPTRKARTVRASTLTIPKGYGPGTGAQGYAIVYGKNRTVWGQMRTLEGAKGHLAQAKKKHPSARIVKLKKG